MGDSVPDGAGGVTLREMLSHMLKPFFSSSLSSSLTSSAASGSNEDRRFTGRSVYAKLALFTRPAAVRNTEVQRHVAHSFRDGLALLGFFLIVLRREPVPIKILQF